MLFDLRGAGRRRTVQAIYLTLAVLMGGGLILFGIGGNTSGGLLDAVKGGGGGGENALQKRVDSLQKRVQTRPRDAHAWAELARARYQVTSTGDNYDQTTGQFTNKGRQQLRSVAQAWDRHLALSKHPDDNVASLMVQAFGPSGLNDLPAAVRAMEIVVDARPKSYALFAQLSALAYAAGQNRKGDLAAQRAVSLAPEDQRPTLRQQLKDAKAQGSGAGGAATNNPTPGSG